MTVAEVAAELRIRSETVRRYIAAGDLVAHRIGRDFRVAPAALEAFLAGNSTAHAVVAREELAT